MNQKHVFLTPVLCGLIQMQFEWDETKNKLNQRKHGVSFEEAKMVFDDPFQLSKFIVKNDGLQRAQPNTDIF